VLLPGTASTADLVRRVFGPALAPLGLRVLAADPPRDGDPVAAYHQFIDNCRADRTGAVRVVGGISLGAHVAAVWAAGQVAARGTAGLDGLLLALPAWTGVPDPAAVAAAAAGAARIRAGGVPAALAGLPDHWVTEELALAWSGYTADQLAAVLERTAAAPAPTPAELATVDCPVGIAAFRDDPLHPYPVAERWAAAFPRAALVGLDLADGADRARLGHAAVRAWRAAGGRH
jgi:pimeloyl-ACP methyl ester carboxylesterase